MRIIKNKLVKGTLHMWSDDIVQRKKKDRILSRLVRKRLKRNSKKEVDYYLK